MFVCMYICIKRQNGIDQGYNIVERKVLGKKIQAERVEILSFLFASVGWWGFRKSVLAHLLDYIS